VAGEHCDHGTRLWSEKHFKVPVLDNWWQTETAHAITASCVGLGNSLSPPKDVSGMPVPGFDGKDKRAFFCETSIHCITFAIVDILRTLQLKIVEIAQYDFVITV
jgi:hypothetical protein